MARKRRSSTPKPKPDAPSELGADLVVCIGDLHAGSTVALIPPMCPLLDDGWWDHNAIQAWLWECWGRFWEDVKRIVAGRRFALVVNGDAIEGLHHRTMQVVHADPGCHIKIAAMLLREHAKNASKVYLTRGTEAHVGHSAESGLGSMIGAEKHPASDTHAPYHWLIRHRKSRLLMSVKHHMSTTSRHALEASGMGIHLAEERMQCANAGWPMPDVVIRSHRHIPGMIQNSSGAYFVSLPAWQALTSYGWKVVPNAIPVVGGAVVDLSGDEARVQLLRYKAKSSPIVEI